MDIMNQRHFPILFTNLQRYVLQFGSDDGFEKIQEKSLKVCISYLFGLYSVNALQKENSEFYEKRFIIINAKTIYYFKNMILFFNFLGFNASLLKSQKN